MGYVKTFENFNLEPIETIQVRRDRQRNVYSVDNVRIYVDDVVPHNVFKPSYHTAIIDYIVLDNEANRNIVEKKYKGFIDPNIYTEEGYGHIGFNSLYIDSDDALQYAIDFFRKEKENLITN